MGGPRGSRGEEDGERGEREERDDRDGRVQVGSPARKRREARAHPLEERRDEERIAAASRTNAGSPGMISRQKLPDSTVATSAAPLTIT